MSFIEYYESKRNAKTKSALLKPFFMLLTERININIQGLFEVLDSCKSLFALGVLKLLRLTNDKF